MRGLTISRLAKRAGVGVETIRFYQRKGLIEQPERPLEGYRTYPEEAVRRVRFIRRAKELGFTLREVAELLALRIDETTTCADVRDRATRKMEDVDKRIADLHRVRAALDELVATCSTADPTGDCPILDSLEPLEASDA